MRIGYESLLTGPRETGVGIAIRELLSALTDLSPDDEFSVFSHRSAARRLPERANVRHVPCPFAAWGRPARILWQQTALRRELRRNPIDIYHAPGYVVSPNLPVPTVVSVYDTIALERPELTRPLNAAHYRWAVPRGVRAASRVLVPSKHVRQRIMAITGVRAEKVQVVPLGISRHFRPLAEEEICSRLGVLGGLAREPFVLCVGNLERKKNLDTAVQAFASLPASLRNQAKLVLVGKSGNGARQVTRLIRKADLSAQILFPGYVEIEVLVALYSAARVLLYPSFEEGFGLPPLEAMACGAPVIASSSGALPETVGNAGMSVHSQDVDAWAAALETVLRSAALRQELRERGLIRAARFNWEQSAAAVLEVYHEVLHTEHATPPRDVAAAHGGN